MLDALDSATKAAAVRDDNGSDDAGQPRVSIRRAAKLVRCCALFLEEDEDDEDEDEDDDDGDVYGANDRGLRDRVVSHLARSMPSSSSSSPSSSSDVGGGPLPRSAAALDGLLVEGEGDSPDDGGSSSQRTASFERLQLLLLSRSCLWPMHVFRLVLTLR